MLMTQPTIIGAALVILVAAAHAGTMVDSGFGFHSHRSDLAGANPMARQTQPRSFPQTVERIATCAISICALVFVWSFMQWASWYK